MQRSTLAWLAVILAAHLLAGPPAWRPVIFGDEAGYLGHARFFAHGLPAPVAPVEPPARLNYYFGYSVLLTPLFWVVDDPSALYRGALLLNALLLTALFLPLRALLRSLLDAGPGEAAWAAGLACLYPAYLFHSHLALAEAAVTLGLALAFLALARLLESPSGTTATWAVLAGLFTFMVHPRTLPVVALVALALGLLAARGRLAWPAALVGLAALGAGLAAIAQMDAWLGMVREAPSYASRIRGVQGRAAEKLLTQTWALLTATYGLAGLGAWRLARSLGADQPAWRRQAVALVLAGAAALAFVSASATAGGKHADHLIYGRYNESFAPLLLAAGFCWLAGPGPWKPVAGVLGLVLAGGACLSGPWFAKYRDYPMNLVNVAGFNGFLAAWGLPLRPWLPALAAVGALGGAWLLARLLARRGSSPSGAKPGGARPAEPADRCAPPARRAWVPALLLAALWAPAWRANHELLGGMQNGAPFPGEILAELQRRGPPPVLDCDRASAVATHHYTLQFLLPHTELRVFDSSRGERPRTGLYLGGLQGFGGSRLASDGASVLWSSHPLPPPSYLGVNLAFSNLVTGVFPEERLAGRPARWTTGHLAVRVPLARTPPAAGLRLSLLDAGRRSANPLQVRAGGRELFDGVLPGGPFERVFPLHGIPWRGELLVEVTSGTFRPSEVTPGSTDGRDLGVCLLGLWLEP